MNISEFSIKITKEVENLDSKKLDELYGQFLNFLNSNKEDKEWSKLSNDEKEGIEEAISQMDEDKGIPHSIVISKMKAKFKYA